MKNGESSSINPKHYAINFINGVEIQAINYFQAVMPFDEFLGYCKGNSMKYLTRSDKKHEQQLEDLQKARRNLDFAINHLQNKMAVEQISNNDVKEFGAFEKFKILIRRLKDERKSNERSA